MRGLAITHFMWQWQHLFRHSIDGAAKYALRAIGAGVDPVALVVGFRANAEAAFDYCIEPENEPIGQADLTDVLGHAAALYEAHEDSQMFHTDPGVHELRQSGLKDNARRQALCDALSASEESGERYFFASRSQRIGDYQVHAVIGVIATRWDALPTLTTRRRDRMDLIPSLAEAVVDDVLRRASTAMALREPPQGLDWDTASDTQDIIRSAAHRFVTSVALLSGQWFGTQLHEHIDAVAAQPYEGRTGVGTIVLAGKEGPTAAQDLEVAVTLRHPIRVSDTRAFRKVLEMSGQELHILCDGEDVYGLGRISDDYDQADERAFHLTVVGRGSWELSHGDVPLLRVDNTRPRLPQSRLSADQFSDTVERLFPEATDEHVASLWDLAGTAAEQEHGTMLVVHRHAAAEAERLVPQALAINPVRLEADSLRAITNIDGAVVVSPDALCHAVGVILDGKATGDGDASRGARFNSAVRYRHAAGDECLVIIVSEDGMIDLLPNLKPRVDRERVERAVQALVDEAEGEVNFERFYRARGHVESVAFYLTEDQCALANAATDRVEDYRLRTSSMQVGHGEFRVHPDMNDSFYF